MSLIVGIPLASSPIFFYCENVRYVYATIPKSETCLVPRVSDIRSCACITNKVDFWRQSQSHLIIYEKLIRLLTQIRGFDRENMEHERQCSECQSAGTTSLHTKGRHGSSVKQGCHLVRLERMYLSMLTTAFSPIISGSSNRSATVIS